jgi:hypothetical protein
LIDESSLTSSSERWLRMAQLFLYVLGLSSSLLAQGRPAAELIVTNAKVWTCDKAQPAAEALAVVGGRIVAVGSAAEIDQWRGARTNVVDGRGKLLVPGFNDAHVHFFSGGSELDNADLKRTRSPEEFANLIGGRARARPGEWILGGNWDDQNWSPARLPTKEMIDTVTSDTPVFVSRYDGHMALANSLALQKAGVTSSTKSPAGGEIVRDAAGNPTGLLKDAAMSLVMRVVPPLSREQRLRTLRRALRHAAELGVTSIQDMGTAPEEFALLAELAERGELTVRVYAAAPIGRWEDQAKLGLRRAFGSDWLRTGTLKGYADGSLGSSTAYFFEPFLDAPGKRGLLSDEMHPPQLMRERMRKADAAGLQLCIHAIGDQANSIILDMFAQVVKANGERDRRLRIEHAQHMAAKDFTRYAQQKVIASVQPYHAIDDGRWAEKRIGDRIKTTYAFRTFLDSGVRLALGTDWPVAALNPLETIYAAVTRATLDGKNPEGWVPEQKISITEALEAYTAGSAFAEFQEGDKGSIAPGKLADFVLLSDDIFTIPPVAIRDVKVLMTVVDGKVVWDKQ